MRFSPHSPFSSVSQNQTSLIDSNTKRTAYMATIDARTEKVWHTKQNVIHKEPFQVTVRNILTNIQNRRLCELTSLD